MKVAVVGSINMDIVARVAHVPLPGETLLARSSSRGGGGKGANQAVAAARARGASVAFIGAVGDDGDGQALRAALEADGIDVTGLESSDSPTGVALISVADDGENAIVVIAGANAADAALSAPAARARLGCRRRRRPARDPARPACWKPPGCAAPARVFVLNASPSAPFADAALAERLLSATDILVVNEHELRDITRSAAGAVSVAIDAAGASGSARSS